MPRLKGLFAAPYTAFDARGDINLGIIPAYADYLKKSGVSGVFVNGTTGEGLSLSCSERKRNAEIWVNQKSESFKVLIHVGHNSIREAIDLSKHAATIGADGFGAFSTSFFKPKSEQELVSLNMEIAKAAESLPFYYYHIPSMTGADFKMIEFLKLASKSIPNLAGIKYTHNDLYDMEDCINFSDHKFDILHGRDEILDKGLSLGVKAAIGSTYNYMAPIFVKIIKAFEEKDMDAVKELQAKAVEIIDVLIKYGGAVQAGKSFMRLIGLDFGQPRLPVVGLDSTNEQNLNKELKALHFLTHSLKP